MSTDAWDTTDAFRPGSVRFGWMVTPVAVVIQGDDMNQREKVMEAVKRLNKSMEEKLSAEAALFAMQALVNDARGNLIKTLHAVYGDRSQHGVVIDGHLYRIVEDKLCVQKVEFEVLS